MRQPLRVDHDMTLDSRNLFAGVVPFAFGAIGILDALRINDAKCRLLVAPKADAGRANRIFLMPAPAGSIHLPTASCSICGNTNTPRPISGNRSATSATGNRSSIHTARRKILHIDRFALASSFSARFPVAHALFQIALDSRRLGILVSCIQFTHLLDHWQKDRKQVLSAILYSPLRLRSASDSINCRKWFDSNHKKQPNRQGPSAKVTHGRSDQGSSPCAMPPRSRARTRFARRCSHTLRRWPATASWNRTPGRRWCRSI